MGSREKSEPITETEKLLAATWSTVLGRPEIGRSDNFFDIGGDSLLAIHLQQKIVEHFREEIPVRDLFEHPTLQSQALLIRREHSANWSESDDPIDSRFMVPLRSEGSRPPFFFVTGAGDVMGIYGTLVSLLDSDQPFFGFPDPMYTSLSSKKITVELLAKTYLREIRARQPEGPYYLGGYSVGGIVAFEIARRLRESGENVARLVVLDSAPPEFRRGSLMRRWIGAGSVFMRFASTLVLLCRRRKTVVMDLRFLLGANPGRDARGAGRDRPTPSKRDYIMWSLRDIRQRYVAKESECADIRERFEQLRMLEDPHLYRRYRSSRAALGALHGYSFPSYGGSMTVIYAERGGLTEADTQSAFGWREVAEGGVTIRSIPGTHTSIFRRPDVEELARALNDCLREAN